MDRSGGSGKCEPVFSNVFSNFYRLPTGREQTPQVFVRLTVEASENDDGCNLGARWR